MNIHIFNIDCTECGIECWVNNGDVDDLTVGDVEAVRCWHCHHEFVLDTEEEPRGCLVEDTYKSAMEAAGE